MYLALRFTLATCALGFVYRRDVLRLSAAELRAGATIGACMFGGYALQTAGIRLTTPSKAAFITGFSVVLVPVLLGVFARRRTHPTVWAGALAALAGLYLLAIPASGLADLNRGDVLVLGGAVSYALHIISVGHFAGAGRAGARYSAGALSFTQVATTAALVLASVGVGAAAGWQPTRVVWSPVLIAAVLVTGLLGTAQAFSAQVWAQQYASASHTAILLTMEPIFAAATSFVFLGERLGGRSLA